MYMPSIRNFFFLVSRLQHHQRGHAILNICLLMRIPNTYWLYIFIDFFLVLRRSIRKQHLVIDFNIQNSNCRYHIPSTNPYRPRSCTSFPSYGIDMQRTRTSSNRTQNSSSSIILLLLYNIYQVVETTIIDY